MGRVGKDGEVWEMWSRCVKVCLGCGEMWEMCWGRGM